MNLRRQTFRCGTTARGIAGLLAISALAADGDAAEETRQGPVIAFGSDEASEKPDFADSTEALEEFLVTTPAYRPPMTPEEQARLRVHLNLTLNFGLFLQSNNPALVLTPARIPERTINAPYSLSVLTDTEIHSPAAITLLDALLRAPDLATTARRHDSPPAARNQHLELRGLSATVLRDGVPVSDPFTGDVLWSAVPFEGLARAEVVSAGGATAWGNGALGGVVQFFTRPAMGRMVTKTKDKQAEDDPTEKRFEILRTARVVVGMGDRDTVQAEFAIEEPTANGIVQVLGRGFSTGGAFLIAADQRGPIDQPAWSRERLLETRWRQPLSATLEFSAAAGFSDASAGAGTPYQNNDTRRRTFSVNLAGSPSFHFAWNGAAYYHDTASSHTASLVDVARQSETPWIDEYAVPARAFGASWTGAWWASDNNSRTTVGADVRVTTGESRQHTDFVGDRFTQRRIAGGREENAGLFLARHQYFSPKLRGSIGVRLDAWRETDGHLRENELATGAAPRDIAYEDDRGLEASPGAGVVWRPSTSWRVHLNGQAAFRRPSLAERYRTVAHRGVLTESNPDLRTAHNTSLELGVAHTLSRNVSLQAAAYANRLTGFAAPLRRTKTTLSLANIDAAEIDGVRVGAGFRPLKALTIETAFLWSRSRISHFDLVPGLVDHELPRVPRQSVTAAAVWQIRKGAWLHLRLQALGRPFVDVENTTRFDDAVIADTGLRFTVSERTEIFLTGVNIMNAHVATDHGPGGEIYLGSPRTWFGGVRFTW